MNKAILSKIETRRYAGTRIKTLVTCTLRVFFLILLGSIPACTPIPPPEQGIINAYATAGAEPWLAGLYACAVASNVTIKISAESPQIILRIGEPSALAHPAYQIGSEEILMVTQNDNPLAELTPNQARTLFTQGNPSGQVWVYASDSDIQTVFDQLVLNGLNPTSGARVAVSPQEMSAKLQADIAAIGILPRSNLPSNLRVLASAGSVPILALTQKEPAGVIVDLITCLQDT